MAMLNERLSHQVEAAMEGLRALMATSPHLDRVTLGAPDFVSEKPIGWVLFGIVGGVGVADGAVRSLVVDLNCLIAVLVADAVDPAERMLGVIVSDMAMRLALNMTAVVDGVGANLNGSCAEMGYPWTPSSGIEYALAKGQETRQHMLTVRVTLKA